MTTDKTEDEKIIQRITDACKRFYEVFDCYPEKVGVHFQRHSLTHYTMRFPFFPLQSLSLMVDETPDRPISFHTVSFEPYMGIGWSDFVIYSEHTGVIKPKELEPGIELIEKLFELQGFRVSVAPVYNTVDEQKIDLYRLWIGLNDLSYHWAFPASQLNQGFEYLKWEIDAVIRRLRTEHETKTKRAWPTKETE